MKRKITFLLAAMLGLLFVTGCGGSKEDSSSQPDSSQQMVGAYTEDRDLTDEDRQVFDTALEGLTGVSYEPEKVATQVVAGTNYRFLCKATLVTPDTEEKYAYVYIFKPLEEDEPPTLTEIVDIEE